LIDRRAGDKPALFRATAEWQHAGVNIDYRISFTALERVWVRATSDAAEGVDGSRLLVVSRVRVHGRHSQPMLSVSNCTKPGE
jgi:hypothetical protein